MTVRQAEQWLSGLLVFVQFIVVVVLHADCSEEVEEREVSLSVHRLRGGLRQGASSKADLQRRKQFAGVLALPPDDDSVWPFRASWSRAASA